MAEAKESKAAEKSAAAVQQTVEDAQEAGHWPADAPEKPIPNEEFSLETGPDSPSAAEQFAAAAEKRRDEYEAAAGGE